MEVLTRFVSAEQTAQQKFDNKLAAHNFILGNEILFSAFSGESQNPRSLILSNTLQTTNRGIETSIYLSPTCTLTIFDKHRLEVFRLNLYPTYSYVCIKSLSYNVVGIKNRKVQTCEKLILWFEVK